ncbi:MAG TPA: hypothetical protein VMQ44_01950 [Candidatus Saccharimonadales bacterium]|nr:hypothetical protein [Candidatus Saccharimonadales bacterium]
MKTMLALAGLVLAILFVGCGGGGTDSSTSLDPLAGQWNVTVTDHTTGSSPLNLSGLGSIDGSGLFVIANATDQSNNQYYCSGWHDASNQTLFLNVAIGPSTAGHQPFLNFTEKIRVNTGKHIECDSAQTTYNGVTHEFVIVMDRQP